MTGEDEEILMLSLATPETSTWPGAGFTRAWS